MRVLLERAACRVGGLRRRWNRSTSYGYRLSINCLRKPASGW
ncbi:hypothetical protein PAMC26510_03005 [Caballeronia sordidicola]|uniref:Uncharacterized protein n=1 Tax=Caballeronia sordidicola TaxID=196367 RepID=A0A242NAB1_CABSO|nr:hypothetical protein PAMC26510_03005 [Caballeronia sordidicola]